MTLIPSESTALRIARETLSRRNATVTERLTACNVLDLRGNEDDRRRAFETRRYIAFRDGLTVVAAILALVAGVLGVAFALWRALG